MTIRIYHNPRCSKSRQTLQLIHAAGVEPEIIEYIDHPPTQKELDEILRRLGMEPQDLMRRGESLYKELDLKNRQLTRTEAIKILVENPKLIERPIVVKGSRAVLGRPPENVRVLLEE